MPPAESKRRRGGQPGNLNAVKHGYYSRQFHQDEIQDLESGTWGGVLDEIAMLKVAIRRLFEQVEESPDPDACRKSLGALGLAAVRLARLVELQKSLGNGDELMLALSQALVEINMEMGWK